MITLPAPEVPVIDPVPGGDDDEDCPPKGEGPDGPSTPGGEEPGDGDGTGTPGDGGTDTPSQPGGGDDGTGTGTPGNGDGGSTGGEGGSSTDTGSSPGGGSDDSDTGISVGDDVAVPVAHESGHTSRVPGSDEGRAQLAQTGASAVTGMEMSTAAAMLAFGAGAVVYARRKRTE